MSGKLVLIAAGGTGGHMFPARAFADALIARGARVALVTDPRGARYAEGFPAETVITLPVANADEGGLLGKMKASLGHARGLALMASRMGSLNPGLITGFGGYPSFPALAVAGSRPILIHEQNAVLGRVNRFFQNRAGLIASGFGRLDRLQSANAARHVVTGNPVRAAIVGARDANWEAPVSGGPIRILVTGGSQGARLFGTAIPAALAGLPEAMRSRLEMVHQVRAEQVEVVQATYATAGIAATVAPFFSDIAERISWSHLVIGRAGASTVSEIAIVGRAAILIPLAIAANDHQTANAAALADCGAAEVIAEAALTPERLTASLAALLDDSEALLARAAAARAVGKPGAADSLVEYALKLAR